MLIKLINILLKGVDQYLYYLDNNIKYFELGFMEI